MVCNDPSYACDGSSYDSSMIGVPASVACAATCASFVPPRGPTSCMQCPAGTYSANGSAHGLAACIPCANGTHSNATGANSSSTCTPCAAGSYSSIALADSDSCRRSFNPCLSIRWGYWGSDAATVCNDPSYVCDGSSYDRSMIGVPASVACAATCASFVPPRGPTSCIQCPAGTYSANGSAHGRAACIPCANGTHSNAIGANSSSTCTPCAAGSYSSIALADSASCRRSHHK